MYEELVRKIMREISNVRSVVIFGSTIKGCPAPNDLDILVLADNLPDTEIGRNKISTRVGFEFIFKGITPHITLMEPSELRRMAENFNPFTLELMRSHKVLHDDESFNNIIKWLSKKCKARNIKFREGFMTWENLPTTA